MTRVPAKAKRTSAPTNGAPASPGGRNLVALQADDFEEAALIEIVKTDELWSTYTLKDGTVLRVRPVVTEVRKHKNLYNEMGEPVYGMRSTLVIDTRVAKSLLKK